MNANSWRYVLLACVMLAVTGFAGFTSTGCADLMVRDPDTGEWRTASAEEIAAWQAQELAHAGDIAKTALVSTGQAAYIPFVDIGIRLAAALAAFFALSKQKKATGPP